MTDHAPEQDDTDLLGGGLPEAVSTAFLGALGDAAALLTTSGDILSCNQRFRVLMGAEEESADLAPVLLKHLDSRSHSQLRLHLAGYVPPLRKDAVSDADLLCLSLTSNQDTAHPVWVHAKPIVLPELCDETGPVWLATFHPDPPFLTDLHGVIAEDGVGLLSKTGMVRHVSALCGQLLRAEPAALRGEHIAALAREEDRENIRQAIATATDGQAVSVRLTTANGEDSPRHLALTFYPDTNGWGPTSDLAFHIRDITDVIELEAERDQAREQCDRARSTKSRFLAGISHELRTPLNAILGFADILQKELFGPLGNEAYKEYVDLIRESGSSLRDLIYDILDLARLDSGRYVLQTESLDMTSLLQEWIAPWVDRAAVKGITLNFDIPEESAPFVGDRMAMAQIINNIVSNAVKYTEKGGTVSVRLIPNEHHLVIAVDDTGIGIPAHIMPKLGRPFEEMVAENADDCGSRGMGLAITQALTTLHGGSLNIESASGKGTHVQVTIPAVESSSAEAAA